MGKKKKTRLEHDFLGEMEIPDDVYYGVQTLRALENFKITDIPIAIEPKMIQALGYVKKAAAMANMDLAVLPQEVGQAIVEACDSLINLQLLDQFQVDAIQGGAGTSTNIMPMRSLPIEPFKSWAVKLAPKHLSIPMITSTWGNRATTSSPRQFTWPPSPISKRNCSLPSPS